MAQTFGLETYRFTKGKWLVLAAAVLMVGLGLAVSLTASGDGATRPGGAGGGGTPSGGLLGSSFAESAGSGSGTVRAAQDQTGLGVSDLSPFLLKGGFGLFIGFAIGFAIRAFLRLAVVVLGFYLLSLTVLAYLGWVEIHWDVMEAHVTRSLSTLGEQFTSFKAFLTGAIPASGLTALGLSFGLRRK